MFEQFLSFFVKGAITGVVSFATKKLLSRWFDDNRNE